MEGPKSRIICCILDNEVAIWNDNLGVSSHRIDRVKRPIPEPRPITQDGEVMPMEMHGMRILREGRIINHNSHSPICAYIVDLVRVEQSSVLRMYQRKQHFRCLDRLTGSHSSPVVNVSCSTTALYSKGSL